MYFSQKTGRACVLQASQVVLIAIIVNFERRFPATRPEFYTLSTQIDLGTHPVKVLKEALESMCVEALTVPILTRALKLVYTYCSALVVVCKKALLNL